jgi:hypothetical protein
MLTTKPNSQVNLIVTADELADYLNTEIDTFFLPALRMAGDYFVSVTGLELGVRQNTVYGKREPVVYEGLSPIGKNLTEWVEVPIYPIKEVISLELDGETATAEIDLHTRPHKLYIGDAEEVKLIVNAGHGQSELSEMARMAVLMLAGFIVEHRGACDLTDGAIKSGAQQFIDKLTIYPFMI